MAIFKHNGAWRAQVYIAGRCVASSSGFKSKSEAKVWHDETRLARTRDPEPVKAATIEDLIERFRTWHLPSVGPRTREIYELEIRRRVVPFFQFTRLERIDPPMLEAYKATLGQKLSPRSANDALQFVSLLLGKAVKWRMLRESPYALEPFVVPMQAYRWWSEREHVDAFLREARASRYYGFYLTAVTTGLRLGELLGLAKDDVDFEHGMIHVHRQWTRAGRYEAPKHNKERWVSFDVDSELGRVLRQVIAASRHPEAVFVTANGKRPMRANVAGKYFQATIKRAKVPPINFHGLRHTFASWYMRDVGDIWALKETLGHSDIKTTQRYAHHAKKRRLPTLAFTATHTAPITHKSHTFEEQMKLTEKNDRGKDWWGCTDSNGSTSRLAS